MVEVWNLPDFVSLGVSAWLVFFTVVSDHMKTNQKSVKIVYHRSLYFPVALQNCFFFLNKWRQSQGALMLARLAPFIFCSLHAFIGYPLSGQFTLQSKLSLSLQEADLKN